MKYVGYLVVGLVAYFAVGYAAAGLGIIALPLFHLQTKVNTNYQLIQKTYDANNVIYNYEWFKSRYEAIQAIDPKISNAQASVTGFESSAGPRSTWTFEDKTEDARLNSVVLGLQNQKQDLIAEYNARAKEANRNIFQNNLPTFINL